MKTAEQFIDDIQVGVHHPDFKSHLITAMEEYASLQPSAKEEGKEIALKFAEWIDTNNCTIKSGGFWIYDSLTDLKTTEQLYTLFLKSLNDKK